ncbi:MAG: hypothetical protein ACKPA7_09300 [Sphaerospermopsis kisseleviana]
MPEISITVTEYTNSVLQELADDAGQSKSSLAAKCIELGLIQEIEGRNKVSVYRKLKRNGGSKND